MQYTSEACAALIPRTTIDHLWDIAEKKEAESCIFVLKTHTLVDDKAQDILILAGDEASHQTVIGLIPVDLTVEVTREGEEFSMEILGIAKAIRALARARRRSCFAARRAKLPHAAPYPAGSRC